MQISQDEYIDDEEAQEVKRLKRRLLREKQARQEAERLLELKSYELYETNINLSQLITQLEHQTKKLEKTLIDEKNLNELQRSFISMASHEFRTPLAIIDSIAQRLYRRADRLPEQKVKNLGSKIRNAVARMTNVMESTLVAAKMEAGKLTIKPELCDIKQILSEVCSLQEDISPRHEIICDLDGLPDTITADASALSQIFTNLLSNAVKYSPKADKVEVRGWCENNQVILSIQDFGVGIDDNDLPNIFKRFFRAKTSSGFEGTGIGLNLVQMLVQEHGGTITVSSRKGEGSIFTVRLPHEMPNTETKATENDEIVLFEEDVIVRKTG